MCRLFGLLGGPAASAEGWFLWANRSFLRQSNASPETAQKDGWGIGWYDPHRQPRVVKGVGGAFVPTEREQFERTAHEARGPVIIGHVRHASNPLQLQYERLIGQENSQPFVHGSCLFAHNGSIPLPRETRPLLGKFESHVVGVNDSEVLFWLLIRYHEETGDPLVSYQRAIEDLVTVWEEAGRPKPGPYTALNVIFSRGPNDIWAFCHWLGDHGGGLLDEHRPYFEMVYRSDSKEVIVGSEPFDDESDWVPIPNRTYLHATADRGLVVVDTGPLTVPKVIGALA